MSTTIKVDMKPAITIVTRLGLGRSGDVQRFVTSAINRRITRYMPYRSSALSTKLKLIKSHTEIEVLGPYARYQYYGKVMAGPAPRVVTGKDLDYTQSRTHNPRAGPFWDRALMAAEGKALQADLQRYVDRKAGKR